MSDNSEKVLDTQGHDPNTITIKDEGIAMEENYTDIFNEIERLQLKIGDPNTREDWEEEHYQTLKNQIKTVPHIVITSLAGESRIYGCIDCLGKIETKVARWLQTIRPCISLVKDNGENVIEDDVTTLSNILYLMAINEESTKSTTVQENVPLNPFDLGFQPHDSPSWDLFMDTFEFEDEDPSTLAHFSRLVGHEEITNQWLFYHCTRIGWLEGIRYLLKCGVPCDHNLWTELSSNTPLFVASQCGHLELVQLFLNSKANMTTVCKAFMRDRLCLSGVLWNSLPKYVSSLFWIGRVDEKLWTPQYTNAITWDHCTPILQLLVDHGYDFLHTDDAWSPFYEVMGSNEAFALSLLHYVGHSTLVMQLERQHVLQRTILHNAALGNQMNVCTHLLEKKARINVSDIKGNTPLHYSVFNAGTQNISELFSFLITSKADVNAKNKTGHTPLHMLICKYMNHRIRIENIENTYLTLISLLIQNNADINATDIDGNTALALIFIINPDGYDRIIEKKHLIHHLLNLTANPNIQNNDGKTPLFLSIRHPELDATTLLHESNGDPHLVTKTGKSLLMHASFWVNPEFCITLLRCKADIHKKNHFQQSALHRAAQRNGDGTGVVRICSLLLENNAMVDECDHRLMTPLMYATDNRNRELCIFLLEHRANVNIRDINGCTALTRAVEKCNVTLCTVLLEYGAIVNKYDSKSTTITQHLETSGEKYDVGSDLTKNDTILHKAVLNEWEGTTIILLLQAQADIDSTTVRNETPLFLAVQKNYYTICEILLQARADSSITNVNGFSPLAVAAEYGFHESACLLLEAKASPHTVNKNKDTPLSLAVHQGHFNIVTLLEKYSNDLYPCEDHLISILLENAVCSKSIALTTNFLEKWSKDHPRLCENSQFMKLAIVTECSDIIDILLQYGHKPLHNERILTISDIWTYSFILSDTHEFNDDVMHHMLEVETINGYTFLMIAVWHGNFHHASYLLDKNADITACNDDGDDSLIIATKRNFPRIVTLLLETNASVTTQNEFGSSALAIAAESGFTKIVSLLLDADADPHIGDKQDDTPYVLAIRRGHYDIFKIIKKQKNTRRYINKSLDGEGYCIAHRFYSLMEDAVCSGSVPLVTYFLEKWVLRQDYSNNNVLRQDETNTYFDHYELAQLALNREFLEITVLLSQYGIAPLPSQIKLQNYSHFLFKSI